MKNWENLRFYLEVARQKTVLAASASLGISHATVIRRIKELEEELGGALFKRSQQGYELTPLGAKLYDHVAQIERSIYSIEHISRKESQDISGRLVISCPDSDMVNVFPTIKAFTQSYPDVTIELKVSTSYADLSKKEVDIAIRMTNSPPEELIGRKVTQVNWGVFISDAYHKQHSPIHNLSDIDWIIWRRKAFVVGKSWLDEHVENVKPIVDTPYSSEVLNAVKNSLGAGILSHDTAKAEGLICIAKNIRTFDLWILTHPDSRDVAKISTFMSFFAKHFHNTKQT